MRVTASAGERARVRRRDRATGEASAKLFGILLEIPRSFAVFHGGFGGLVVGAGAALGDAGGGDLGDDVIQRGGRGLDAAGADDVANGADAHDEVLDLLAGFRR